MQITFTTRHGQLSEDSQERLKVKVEKLSRFFDRLTAIELVIDLQDEDHPKVDLKASAEHKRDFVASEQTGNLLSSVEAVVHKVEQQLRKHKERSIDKHRDSTSKRLAGEPEE